MEEKSKEELEIARLESLVQQLNDEKEVLKDEKRAIENYMHTLIHDFKTPICSISNFSEFILDDSCSKDEKDEFAKIIMDVSGRMLRMVESYLLLSKLGHLGGKLDKKTKTVMEIISGVKQVFSKTYDDNSLHISVKNPEDFTVASLDFLKKEVELDPDLFFSAMTNLVNNAIEASGYANVNIFSENNFFCVNVSNNGTIAKDIEKKLFQEYNTNKINGTGLGLFGSKRIMEAHGGSLVYKPTPNVVNFVISIPFK